MFARLIPAVACVALLATAPIARAADTPTILLRIASIDEMLDKGEYLAGLSGQEEVARQAIGFARALAGDKGIEGVDTKRPFALVAHLKSQVQQSPVVVLIPIADKDSFLGLLKNRLNVEPKEEKEGVYKLSVPNVPMPVFFRFAGKYLYATINDSANIAEGALGDPEKLIGKPDGLITLSVRIDEVPEQLKKAVLGQVETKLVPVKKQPLPEELKSLASLRDKAIDSGVGGLKSLLYEGEELTARINVDPKADEIAFEWGLKAKNGTALAEQLAGLKSRKSLSGAWQGKSTAFLSVLHLGLPESVRKALGPVVDELVEKLPDRVPPQAQMFAEQLLKVIAPTLKKAELDLGFVGLGPNKEGKFSFVWTTQVEQGTKIESTIKDIVKQLPAQVQDFVEFDADKADGTVIHALKVGNFLDERARAVVGDTDVWLAFRDDRVVVGVGPEAKTAVATALKATPEAAPVLLASYAVSKLAPLIDPRHAEAAKVAAAKIFAKDDKGDRLTLRVDSGERLQFRIAISGKAAKFFAAVQTAGKE